MSPRRVRFEARVFRGESVAFEPCPGFRASLDAGLDSGVCHCGWLEDDHRRSRVRTPAPMWRRASLPVAFARLLS
jgi:hypothetical protein